MIDRKTMELAIEGLKLKLYQDKNAYAYKQQQDWVIEHYRKNVEADELAIKELEDAIAEIEKVE